MHNSVNSVILALSEKVLTTNLERKLLFRPGEIILFFSTFQVRFNGQRVNKGFLKEWTLLLHGTREAPYSDLPVTDPHSKLAIVKKAHEDKKKM